MDEARGDRDNGHHRLNLLHHARKEAQAGVIVSTFRSSN
jgi:hypothetical protein